MLTDDDFPSSLSPAPIGCDAAYAAPCARTTSKNLAEATAQRLFEFLSLSITEHQETIIMSEFFQNVTDQEFNMNRGFYPFVIRRDGAICMAHGANVDFVNKSLQSIFDEAGIGFSNITDLHLRFLEAAEQEGGWVSYFWTNDSPLRQEINDDEKQCQQHKSVQIHSKSAFVVGLTERYYLGVGYENQQLPRDTPCSAEFNDWCSITNVQSLVGAAQFRLANAANLETFENALYDMSYDIDTFTIDEGFYTFLYSYDGNLKAHPHLRGYFSKTLPEIFVDQMLGDKEDGQRLNELFVETAEAQANGTGTGWVKYNWRNCDETEYEKIGYITKIVFQGEEFYLGSGFRLGHHNDVDDELYHDDEYTKMMTRCDANYTTMMARCDANYNLPCSFKLTLELSSHVYSHIISSNPVESAAGIFRDFTNDPHDTFRRNNFYFFAYDLLNRTCVAHGGNFSYVGMTLDEVYASLDLDYNATQVHNDFRDSAKSGGGFVRYKWKDINIENGAEFDKLSYLFQFDLGSRSYYGGIGFNHRRAPQDSCIVNNTLAVLGQATGDLTLASSPIGHNIDVTLKEMLDTITARSGLYAQNETEDLVVSVFSVDGVECPTLVQDGSGCCIASGNLSWVNKTWESILDERGTNTLIRGKLLHSVLSEMSRTGFGILTSKDLGQDDLRAYTTRFRGISMEGYASKNYYVYAEVATGFTNENQKWFERKATLILLVVSLVLGLGLGIATLYSLYQKRAMEKMQKKSSELNQALAKRALQRAKDQENDRIVKEFRDSMPWMTKVVYHQKDCALEEYKDGTAMIKDSGPATWFWEAEHSQIHLHEPSHIRRIEGRCFVRYPSKISQTLERKYELLQSPASGDDTDPNLSIDLSGVCRCDGDNNALKSL